MADDVWAKAAQRFRQQPPRWASPLDLAMLLNPLHRRTAALEAISQALVDVAEGRTKRLALSMPPQEAKTSTLQAFLLWLLVQRPESRSVMVSYESDIATRTGRQVRDWIETHNGVDGTLDLGLQVRRTDSSAARWTLDGHAGGLVCVGIGGALTGRSVDGGGVLIVDDAFKGHQEAMSSVERSRVWEWFRSTALTRLAPEAAVVVVGTRWHAGDLIGKLTKEQPDEWRVINLPAVADSPDDPLGREVGEPMTSARGNRDWDQIRHEVGEYAWNAMYQGRPSPQGGGVFKADRIRYWTPAQNTAGELVLNLGDRAVSFDACWTVAVADLAASTRTSADWTVVLAVALTPDRDLVVLDMVRERMKPEGHFTAARPLLERWRCHTLFLESMMATTTLVYEATRAGVPISPLTPDKDKITRAMPAGARVDQGKVFIPAGAPWAQTFLDELEAFPNGAHDDICDCLAYAALIAAAADAPPVEEIVTDDDLGYERVSIGPAL